MAKLGHNKLAWSTQLDSGIYGEAIIYCENIPITSGTWRGYEEAKIICDNISP